MGCVTSMLKMDASKTGKSSPALTKSATAAAQPGPTPVEMSGCLKQFMTAEERTQLLASDQLYITSKLLLNPPFTTFSAFNDRLFITGYGGLTVDMLISKRIKALVNVSEEIYLDITSAKDSLLHFRYPLRENYSFAVEEYFDKVADKINDLLELNEGGVIVFCIAGFSRSATMVLAYAIKYLKLSLREAFRQLQQARPYARPNLIFMEKLVAFEMSCLGSASIVMSTIAVDLKDEGNESSSSSSACDMIIQVNVPHIYKKEYPHLYTLEEHEAHQNWKMLRYTSTAQGNRAQSGLVKVTAVKKSQSGLNAGSSAYDESTNELRPFIVEPTNYRRFVREVLKARENSGLKSKSSAEKPKTKTPTAKKSKKVGTKGKTKSNSKSKTKNLSGLNNTKKSKSKGLLAKATKSKQKVSPKRKDKIRTAGDKAPKKSKSQSEKSIDIGSGYTSGVSSASALPVELFSLAEGKVEHAKMKVKKRKMTTDSSSGATDPKSTYGSVMSMSPKGSSALAITLPSAQSSSQLLVAPSTSATNKLPASKAAPSSSTQSLSKDLP